MMVPEFYSNTKTREIRALSMWLPKAHRASRARAHHKYLRRVTDFSQYKVTDDVKRRENGSRQVMIIMFQLLRMR